jgi:hypothetical protein
MLTEENNVTITGYEGLEEFALYIDATDIRVKSADNLPTETSESDPPSQKASANGDDICSFRRFRSLLA